MKKFQIQEVRSSCLCKGCLESAIYSHSIQENGVLSLLEDDVKKNGRRIFSLEDYPALDFKEKHLSTFFNSKRSLKSFAKSKASGLYMFCKKHDKEMFREIEDVSFVGSQKQLFLHSIRAFLYSSRKEQLYYSFINEKLKSISKLDESTNELKNTFSDIDKLIALIPDNHVLTNEEASLLSFINDNSILLAFRKQMKGTPLVIDNLIGKTGKELKKNYSEMKQKIENVPKFDNSLKSISSNIEFRIKHCSESLNYFVDLVHNKLYSSLHSVVFTLNLRVPIAGSFLVGSDFSEDIPEFSMTIFPKTESSETVVVLSSMLKEKSKLFFRQLNILSIQELQLALSNIIILFGSNTFIAPRMWDKFSKDEQDYFLSNKSKGSSFSLNTFNNKVNLFSEKFHDS